MPTFRLCGCGTRQVLLVEAVSVAEWLSQKNDMKLPEPKLIYGAVQQFDKDTLAAYIASSRGNAVYHKTAGPKEMIYVPTGYMFVERIGRQNDYIGVVQRVLVSDLAPELTRIKDYLDLVSKPSDSAKLVLDYINNL